MISAHMVSQGKMQQQQAGGADLPIDLVERVLARLPERQRARCGLVCRQWLAASRRPALWQAVHWSSERDSIAELLWLGGRSGAQNARLRLDPSQLPSIAFCLGAWAASLQRLSLTCADTAPEDGLACLGGLQQLTWLHLDVRTAGPPRDQLACLSALRRLAVLDWQVVWPTVATGDEDSDEEGAPAEAYHLPALPASLRHLMIGAGTRMVLVEQLPALTRLQTLVYDVCYNAHALAALGSLRGLTALVTCECRLGQLPSLLPALTSLHYLDLSYCDLGGHTGIRILQQLRRLLRLQWLALRNCHLLSLAPLAGAGLPLRALDVSHNPAAFLADMCCLATLEYLCCEWTRMPPPAACATAARLKTVVLRAQVAPAITGAQAAQALPSLMAMPALELLYIECCARNQEVVAALKALQQARPRLRSVQTWLPAAPWGAMQSTFEY